jgi:cation transporter-like permease
MIATSVALAAFAVAVVAGLYADNSADAILKRALFALIILWVAGHCVGRVFEHIVRVHLRKIDATTKLALAEPDSRQQAITSVASETRAAASSAPTNLQEDESV